MSSVALNAQAQSRMDNTTMQCLKSWKTLQMTGTTFKWHTF